jgi:hypothetical protein
VKLSEVTVSSRRRSDFSSVWEFVVPVYRLASVPPLLKNTNPLSKPSANITVQLGVKDGSFDGWSLGLLLGSLDGSSDGMVLGAALLVLLGSELGVEDGCFDGWSLGLVLGSLDGLSDGMVLGAALVLGSELGAVLELVWPLGDALGDVL